MLPSLVVHEKNILCVCIFSCSLTAHAGVLALDVHVIYTVVVDVVVV